MENFIITVIRNRGEEMPTIEQIEEKLKELVYDNEIYVKKI